MSHETVSISRSIGIINRIYRRGHQHAERISNNLYSFLALRLVRARGYAGQCITMLDGLRKCPA
jgi:hypothetical protein